jgi:DNA-binding CsgD family transcriptional regulator
MQLVERAHQLQQLTAAFDAMARERRGTCALVYGEAGIGKTALVREFLARHGAQQRILMAGCEALNTPRPLGPLVDLADQFPAALAASISAGHTYNGLFPSFLAFLRNAARPTMLVLEDVHWADAATLDLIRYVGRRLDDVPAMLIVTYRDDELTLDHPLRLVLGGLAPARTLRLGLQPLTEPGVAALARAAGRSASDIFNATGGNPFFVAEALAHVGTGVPASVSDAVLARLAALSAPARAVAELVSVVPGRAERFLIEQITTSGTAAIDECAARGLVFADGAFLGFRHELARQSVEAALQPARRAALHAAVFGALRQRCETAMARLVHHAEHAGLVDEVAALAPEAARAAAAAGAHREAAALLATALKSCRESDTAARTRLLDARARECALANDIVSAVAARREAATLLRACGDRRAEAWQLARLAALEHNSATAIAAVDTALQALESLPPCKELAWAGSVRAMLLTKTAAHVALAQAQRAHDLAATLGDDEVLCHTLNSLGFAELAADRDEGSVAKLERSLALALERDLGDEHVVRACINLTTGARLCRAYDRALDAARRGIAYCESHDLDQGLPTLLLRRAHVLLELGRWTDVDADLDRIDALRAVNQRERQTAQFVRARLAARRGTDNDPQQWEGFVRLTQAGGTDMRIAFAVEAGAEAAWLRGDADAVVELVDEAMRSGVARNLPKVTGMLLVWPSRVGRPLPPHDVEPAEPYALELAGQWRAAADAWSGLGCPYERAVSQLAGDVPAVRQALETFDVLGAAAAADIARRRLRALGARGVERGAYGHARGDPLGLTRREREVFDLAIQGQSTPVIATRLRRSERTIEHHLAAVYAKLRVKSRAELVLLAARQAVADEGG